MKKTFINWIKTIGKPTLGLQSVNFKISSTNPSKDDKPIKVSVTSVKLEKGECICDMVRKHGISGYCHKHHTSWA